jgi:hypothetical protein
MMRRLLSGTFFAASCALVLTSASAAVAFRIAPAQPSPARVAVADVIVVGRVMAIENKEVTAPAAPGATVKTTYRVAVVEVADVVKGAKGLKKVRVGFIPPPKMVPPGGPGGIRPGVRPIRPGFGGVQLKAGDAGLFYLTKHFEAPIYTVPGFQDFTSRGNANFEKELKEARDCTALLADPMASLKSKDNEKRFMTAALLLTKYRQFRPGKTTTEPISAEESKLILTALADAPQWEKKGPVLFGQLHPQTLFFQLNLTPKDGWQPPTKITSPDDYPNAIRAWLRDNANKYRIQRIVPEVSK